MDARRVGKKFWSPESVGQGGLLATWTHESLRAPLFFSLNSLGHLLLPHYLPRLVIAQVSDPSPVFLVLFTPNQRAKTTFPQGLLGRGVFIIWVVE